MASDAWLRVHSGVQESPPFVLLKTPPAALPAYSVMVARGSMARAVTRPDTPEGPTNSQRPSAAAG
jgi:hypothetical protein